MKYLTLEEFFGETANQKTGMSIDNEKMYKKNCLHFIDQINRELSNNDPRLKLVAV